MAELGALSLRIETVGDQQALRALDAIDTKANHTAASEQKLTASQKALNREIAEGTRLFALQGKAIDATSQIAVNELRASAAAQKQWLQAIGASTLQQEQFNRTVQQFEQRIGVFGGSITNAQGRVNAFGRSGLNAFNALSFGISQMAATGTASFRSLATSMTSVLAFFGTQGAIAAGVVATGLVLVDFFTRTRREIEETAKKAKDEVAGLVEAFRQRDAVQVIETALKDLNAQLETNRQNRAAIFDIQARTDAAGFTHAVDQKKLAAIDAERLKLQTAATELTFRLGEANAKVAKDQEDAEQKRRARIAQQISDYETLIKLGKASSEDMRQALLLERALRAELARTNDTELERRATLLQQIATLSGQQIRNIPQAKVTGIVGGGIFAGGATAGTRPPGELAIPPSLQQFFDARQSDIQKADAEMAARVAAYDFHETTTALSESLANALGSAIATGFAQGLGEGGIGEGFKQMAAQLAQGLGSLAIDYGLKAILTAEAMAKIASFLVSNPILAIGAGIALVALGRAFGGRRQGFNAGRAGGGFSGASSASAPTSSSISRLIVDPNASLKQRMSSGMGSLQAAAGPSIQVIEVIGASTPRGQELIGTSNQRYLARRA